LSKSKELEDKIMVADPSVHDPAARADWLLLAYKYGLYDEASVKAKLLAECGLSSIAADAKIAAADAMSRDEYKEQMRANYGMVQDY
jgi:hypothetical protein